MVDATVICTVYNEGNSIEDLLDSMVNQSVTPEEAVFVDAGSSDGTVEKIQEYSEENEWIKLVIEEGCNIAEGRNIAVKKASNDHFVSTDGGCKLHEDWYREMCEKLDEYEFVAGMWKPQGDTLFEKVQGLIVGDKADPEEYRKGSRGPSSRSVGFSQEVWEEVGGYPEDLYTGEDSKFNAKILSKGYELGVADEAWVYWQMRPTWKSFWNQFKTYGEGDAKGGNLFTHPNKKLGISKNFWLLLTGDLTILSLISLFFTAIHYPELGLYNTVIFIGLFSVPVIYYRQSLKKVESRYSAKGLILGTAISIMKYWAWYLGFGITLLRKPSLIGYQLSEARKL